MAKTTDHRITRDTFLFMTPGGIGATQKGQFAQCVSCRMFVPESYLDGKLSGDRCVAHGSKVGIDDLDSCGLYLPWPTPDGSPVEHVVKDHAAELVKGIPGSVTPEESGLVSRQVQCHRCRFEENGATKCGLYTELNDEMPDVFNLDEKITPNSCCNAQEPKSGQGDDGDDDGDDDDLQSAKPTRQYGGGPVGR